MSKRADLAKLLGKHYGTSAAGDDHLWAMADIVLDLLHPVIETYEELDALPVGSVVRTSGDPGLCDPRVAVKTAWWPEIQESHWAIADTNDWEVTSEELEDLPATVLHEPTP